MFAEPATGALPPLLFCCCWAFSLSSRSRSCSASSSISSSRVLLRVSRDFWSPSYFVFFASRSSRWVFCVSYSASSSFFASVASSSATRVRSSASSASILSCLISSRTADRRSAEFSVTDWSVRSESRRVPWEAIVRR